MPSVTGCAPLGRLPLITLYLSERCNSRCVGCDYWRHEGMDADPESIRRLLPGLAALNTRYVLISGGEPLLNSRWETIAALLRSRQLTLWLLTSGLSLAKQASRVAKYFSSVTVSLDGACAETYQATRGLDAFAVVCRGVRRISQLGVHTALRVTVQRANYRELPALIDLAHELGVARISFLAADVSNSTAFGRQGKPQEAVQLSAADLPQFARVLQQLQITHAQDFRSGFIAESPVKLNRLLQYYQALCGLAPFPEVRCNAPEFSAVIEANGLLRPCFFIPGPARHGPAFDVPGALNGHGGPELRAAIRSGERDECRRCVCSMWRDPAAVAAGMHA